ncbi:MAG: HypC/HybG/HupF family hydrogenase formation chaperone [Gammaproteobacteria bacterium]|nr:HypC/HybG/HupF family hydrogenase formation chaperone [Gammaproteobacteria bacterium]MCP5135240.1 HypC/HybG/HupF family hydrogenase formation chaperone [Gammaproteobacteria bacterium]
MCLGIPGQIVAIIDADNGIAKVDVSGVKRDVNIACVRRPDEADTALIGIWVLVHVGFAMSRIDEQEAAKTLALLDQLGEIQPELNAMRETATS